MSAMKRYLDDIIEQVEIVDNASYQAEYQLMVLANLAWANGTEQPVWAPDREWIDVARTQLKEALKALQELEDARGCLDYDA